jgi:hypothetical protein
VVKAIAFFVVQQETLVEDELWAGPAKGGLYGAYCEAWNLMRRSQSAQFLFPARYRTSGPSPVADGKLMASLGLPANKDN